MTEPFQGDPSGEARWRRERAVAWLTTTVACLYCTWMGASLFFGTRGFLEMFKSVGAELPPTTRFVVTNRVWLYPGVFGTAVVILLAKEQVLNDKRLATMVSFLVVIVAHWIAYFFVGVHYLPLIDLIQKLG